MVVQAREGCVVELRGPDEDQVAREVVALAKTVQRLAAESFDFVRVRIGPRPYWEEFLDGAGA
jgi:hypothetical protein